MTQKTIAAVLFLLSTALIFSGCVTKFYSGPDDEMEFSIAAEGTRAELFVKTNVWAVKRFVDSEVVTKFVDREEGVISGRYNLLSNSFSSLLSSEVLSSSKIPVFFIVKISDGQVTLALKAEDNVAVNNPNDPESVYNSYYYSLYGVRKEFEALAASLEKALAGNLLKI